MRGSPYVQFTNGVLKKSIQHFVLTTFQFAGVQQLSVADRNNFVGFSSSFTLIQIFSFICLLILLMLPGINGQIVTFESAMTNKPIPSRFNSFKILIYRTDLAQSQFVSKKENLNVYQAMQFAAQKLGNMLSVKQSNSPLLLDRDVTKVCESIKNGTDPPMCIGLQSSYKGEMCSNLPFIIPDDHFKGITVYSSSGSVMTTPYSQNGTGLLNTDLIIYFSIFNYTACQHQNAVAKFCRVDPISGRPTAGWVNICPSYIRNPATDQSALFATALQSLLHIIGFDKELAMTHIPSTEWSSVKGPNDDIEMWLSSSRITQFSTLHFNCGKGLPFISSDDDRLLWNRVVMASSIMTYPLPDVNWTYLDSGSLSFLEDLANGMWYHADHTQADSFLWGLKAGCSFHHDCSNSNYFCQKQSSPGCHFTMRAKGSCQPLLPDRPSCLVNSALTATELCSSNSNRCLDKVCQNVLCTATESESQKSCSGQTSSSTMKYTKILTSDDPVLCPLQRQLACTQHNTIKLSWEALATAGLTTVIAGRSSTSMKNIPQTVDPNEKSSLTSTTTDAPSDVKTNFSSTSWNSVYVTSTESYIITTTAAPVWIPGRFSVHYPRMNLDELKFGNYEDTIISQFKSKVVTILGVAMHLIINIGLFPGSVIIRFGVNDTSLDPQIYYQKLKVAFGEGGLNLMINDVVYKPDGIEMDDQNFSTAPKTNTIEIIIGAIVGGILGIGLIILVVVLVLKYKIKATRSITPHPCEAPENYPSGNRTPSSLITTRFGFDIGWEDQAVAPVAGYSRQSSVTPPFINGTTITRTATAGSNHSISKVDAVSLSVFDKF